MAVGAVKKVNTEAITRALVDEPVTDAEVVQLRVLLVDESMHQTPEDASWCDVLSRLLARIEQDAATIEQLTKERDEAQRQLAAWASADGSHERMSNNRASRKGVGVERSDYDVVKHAFECAGIAHTESRGTLSRDDAAYEYFRGRGRHAITLAFETTTLYFDLRGVYVGREYMARDECDYFVAREMGVSE